MKMKKSNPQKKISTIKAIIWDVGGVLERTEDFSPRRTLAHRLGWEMNPLMDLVFGNNDGHRVQLGEISYEEHLRNVGNVLGQSQRELKTTLEEFFAGDLLDTELVETIRALRKNYTTAILSNYFPTLREKVNRQWNIGDAFDHLIISSEVGARKPDPKIYQIALEKVSCQAEQAVFLDDFYENVAGAREVGMHAIHFRNPEKALSELQELLGARDQQ